MHEKGGVIIKASKEIVSELERLFNQYETDINKLQDAGILKPSAAKTYLLHSKNFVRWCKDDFEPGLRNKG